VITDIRMPKMDGIALIEAIKARDLSQPIIVTSAHDEAEYLLKLIHLGVDNFITKPLSSDRILETLSKSVGHIFEAKERARYQEELSQLNASLQEEVARQSKDLKESCAKAYAYQQAFYQSGSFLLLNARGEILKAAPHAAKLLGFGVQELEGKPCVLFLHGQTPLRVREDFLASMTKKTPWEGEVVCQTKTMKPLHVHLENTPVFLADEAVEFLLVIQDQTHLKDEEEAAESCLALYTCKHVLDALPLPAAMIDVQGCITLHNFEFIQVVEEGLKEGIMCRLKEGTLHLEEMIQTEDPFLRLPSLWDKKPKGFEVQGVYETVLEEVSVRVHLKPLDKGAKNYLALLCFQGARDDAL
jgi:PAS domain S-box-containing protein